MVTANIRAALSGMPVGIMHDVQAENRLTSYCSFRIWIKASIEGDKEYQGDQPDGPMVAIGDIAGKEGVERKEHCP